MAYGLRYNLQQSLRDSSTLFVNIYQDSYTGSVYNYNATSITIEPNTISDEPEAGIISSQLNVSFLISTQDDFTNFPDLLNFNDRQWYVELTRIPNGGSEEVLWRGYMFNDYVNIPFSTGNLEVNITCIDALSFMKNFIYPYPDNINTTSKLLTVLLTGLNWLGFPTLGNLYSCCSYYGSLMDDRADNTVYEPFNQTYIYKRDLINKNLYDLIEQIMKSFNCRLFQFKGDWWIMSANEMAATNVYFTKYNALSNAAVDSGILSNLIAVGPYTPNGLHFINNTQNKITRKGYPIIKVSTKVEADENYTHNSNFKQGTTVPTGWEITLGTGATFQWLRFPDEEFDVIKLQGASGFAELLAGNIGSTDTYIPFVYAPGFKFSFDAIVSTAAFHELRIYVSVDNFINSRFWLQPDGTWSFTRTSILVGYTNKDQSFQSFSRDIALGTFVISGTSYNVYGKVSIEFQAYSSTTAYIRNPKIVQTINPAVAQSLLVTRTASTAGSLTKELTSYIGLYKSDIPNMYGALFYSNSDPITAWYRFGHAGTFATLPALIAREYSNLLSRNYATLEGDLGATINAFGPIYLAHSFLVADSPTNALSYNGKKFLLNRVSPNFYINQGNSIQLLEITDTDNSSTERAEWIVS
jgi:hypothetical protein